MSRFDLRPAVPGDEPAIEALVNAHSLATAGTRRALIDAYGDLRLARYVPGAAERHLAFDGASPAVFTHIFSRPPHVVVEFGCVIAPGLWGTSWGVELLSRLESRGYELERLAPRDARVVLQTTSLAGDMPMRALLLEHGFERVREWVHFELDLDHPPAVELPAGVEIRAMDPRRDWPAVGAVMDEAFADHWGELGPAVRTLLEEDEPGEADVANDTGEPEDDPYSNSLGLCFVAEADGMVIGSCLCNARTVEWADAGKLGSLSVSPGFRRGGVGLALTATALAEFFRRGTGRVITDTDSASFTGANRLYPRFGFRPYRYEHVYEKELRPGREWRLMAPHDPVT